MKNILVHVRSDEDISNYIDLMKFGNKDNSKSYSQEIISIIEEFCKNDWGVYLTTIDNFKNGIWEKVYFVNENKTINMSITQMNEKINFMIIRCLGCVEDKYKIIEKYLDFLIQNYKGKVLNNPKAMKMGLVKNYLIHLDEKKLKNIEMHTIPTKIYSNKITYNELLKKYKEPKNYLIKSSSGEFSTYLNCLENIDEMWLRKNETLVDGWIIEPIMKEIWDGEYQLAFIGDEVVNAKKKIFIKEENMVLPDKFKMKAEVYYPSEDEIKIAKDVIKYFCDFYKVMMDICRIDYMKNNKNEPILLEIETVNPGFTLNIMENTEEIMKYIAKKLREYCEKI